MCSHRSLASLVLFAQPHYAVANWVRALPPSLASPPRPPSFYVDVRHAPCEIWCAAWIKDDNEFACGQHDCLGCGIHQGCWRPPPPPLPPAPPPTPPSPPVPPNPPPPPPPDPSPPPPQPPTPPSEPPSAPPAPPAPPPDPLPPSLPRPLAHSPSTPSSPTHAKPSPKTSSPSPPGTLASPPPNPLNPPSSSLQHPLPAASTPPASTWGWCCAVVGFLVAFGIFVQIALRARSSERQHEAKLRASLGLPTALYSHLGMRTDAL